VLGNVTLDYNGCMIDPELNDILIALWRKGAKRLGPATQLLVEETKFVAPVIAAIEKDLVGFMQSDAEKLPFLLYHWPLFYQEGLFILGEIPRSLGNVLSMGAPFGPYAVAAGTLGAREVTFLDENAFSLSTAATIAGRLGVSLQSRRSTAKESYDTIIVDNQLPSPLEIGQLSSLLKPSGFLVLIDRAEKGENKKMLQMRDHLVLSEGYAVQAPCVWKGACPALATNFPCFAQAHLDKSFVMKEIQRYGHIEQNSLKMSYLIVRKKGAEWPTLPEEPLYRVVSGAMEGPSGKRFILCGTDGKKRLNLTLAKYPKEARALDYLKRGELIALHEELRQGDDLFAGPGTTAKVVAAIGKPLEEPLE